MVSTSNWPPLVAMSVVTFWRSTFSSSVTHSRSIPGFFALKSSVSFCMRIMSPLLTVAIVSLVSACADHAKPAMTPALKSTRSAAFITASHCTASELLLILRAYTQPRKTRVKPDSSLQRSNCSQTTDPSRLALFFEQMRGRGLVRDQAIDAPALERTPQRAELGRAHAGTDDQPLGRPVEGDARHPIVGRPFDELAVAVEGPTNDLADGSGLDQGPHLVTTDEAVLEQRGAVAYLADADERDVCLFGEFDHMFHRLLRRQKLLLVDAAGDHRKRQRIVGRPHGVGDPRDHIVK